MPRIAARQAALAQAAKKKHKHHHHKKAARLWQYASSHLALIRSALLDERL